MLETPIGYIEVCVDGRPIHYVAECLSNLDIFSELNGRYKIKIEFIPDGNKHTISCYLKNHVEFDLVGVEPGENLSLTSFYLNTTKLSIGTFGEADYSNGIRDSIFDFDNLCVDDGVQYIIFPDTETSSYVFGIAWLNNVNDSNEVQTWYGADPALM